MSAVTIGMVPMTSAQMPTFTPSPAARYSAPNCSASDRAPTTALCSSSRPRGHTPRAAWRERRVDQARDPEAQRDDGEGRGVVERDARGRVAGAPQDQERRAEHSHRNAARAQRLPEGQAPRAGVGFEVFHAGTL